MLDRAVGATAQRFRSEARRFAERLAHEPDISLRLADKRGSRERDEQRKPLAAYRAEELARSHECFFGADRSYHEARHRFVYKLGNPCLVRLGTQSGSCARAEEAEPHPPPSACMAFPDGAGCATRRRG